jgi:hypothetical protein
MLIPININPCNSIYFTGSEILHILQEKGKMSMNDLYFAVKSKYDMSYPILMLSLDWLFLIDEAVVTEEGEVKLCL